MIGWKIAALHELAKALPKEEEDKRAERKIKGQPCRLFRNCRIRYRRQFRKRFRMPRRISSEESGSQCRSFTI